METSTQILLKQVPIFSALDEDALAVLSTHCRRRSFPAGEAIFHEGDPGHTLYVIVRGRVSIQTITASGEVVHIAERGPGEPFGELSLIDGKPRMADAVTSEACDVLVLDREGFLLAIEESPRIALSIMATLADRLRQAADHQESFRELNVTGRLSEFLLGLLQTHGSPTASGQRIDVRFSQQEIAERIGATRETVNRALANLRRVGAIRMEGRAIVVVNPAKLRRYAAR
ncbi:MAG: Crp/Fnr family transcriptional regulator [Chthonomonadales bacterium]